MRAIPVRPGNRTQSGSQAGEKCNCYHCSCCGSKLKLYARYLHFLKKMVLGNIYFCESQIQYLTTLHIVKSEISHWLGWLSASLMHAFLYGSAKVTGH